MKSTKLIFAIGVLATLLSTSCKKTYTCNCTFTNGIVNQSIEIKNHTKEEAEDLCGQTDQSYKQMLGNCAIQ